VIEPPKEGYLKQSIHKLQFENEFAKVEDDKIIFKSYYNKTAFEVADIRKIILNKNRNYKNNMVSLGIGLLLLSGFILKIDLSLKMMLAVSSLLFMVFSIVHKKHDYTMVVLVQKAVIKFKVEKRYKNDAKYIMQRINKYIKKK
jgi:hypothetical protein